MKADSLLKAIRSLGGEVEPTTVDTRKCGDGERDVKKLAVCFIATPRVIHQAKLWGADMILTHEPTFYTHDDSKDSDPVTVAKQKMIEDSGMTICRFHDGMHTKFPDMIAQGFVKQATLTGEMTDSYHFSPATEMNVRELAALIKVRCGLGQVRMIGALSQPVRTIGLYLGAPDGNAVIEDLKEGISDCIVIGETCEWSVGEYVRDAAQLGFPRSMLILGHVGSERDGMRFLTERLAGMFPSVETEYFECEEIYRS